MHACVVLIRENGESNFYSIYQHLRMQDENFEASN